MMQHGADNNTQDELRLVNFLGKSYDSS